MKPTHILSNEHRLILKVLDVLELIGTQASKNKTFDLDDARAVIEFIRTFADKCHHGKEETYLFPAMETAGFSREAGPIAVMLFEHDQGRAHVREMAAAIDRVAKGEADATDRFAHNALGYVQLLREHILKEDNILFRMADQVLTDADKARLLAAFERVEHVEIGPHVHEQMHSLAEQLLHKYGLDKSSCG